MDESNYYELFMKYKSLYEEQKVENDKLRQSIYDYQVKINKLKSIEGRKKKYDFNYDEYKNMKDKGFKDEQIAANLKISIRTLYRYLDSYRDSSVGESSKDKFDYNVYLAKKSNGVPDYLIARDFGISKSTLSRLLKKMKE